MASTSGLKGKQAKREFERNATLPRTRQRIDTLTRMDIDEDGSKSEVIPLRHPPKPNLPEVLLLEPLENEVDPIDIESDDDSDSDETEETTSSAPTQTRAVIDEFMGISDTLQDIIMADYQNHHDGEQCSCGRGPRIVHCNECLQYRTSCSHCFSELHYHNPFHWAHLWDPERRRYKRVDYSVILNLVDGDGAIQLGHIGEKRACPYIDNSIPFTVIHTNGIHSTKLRICRCPEAPDKAIQLMRARLFPATVTDPRTAFTFQTLKEFHMHGLQSKSAAQDYVVSLRRLTDNVFMQNVPDPYKAFLRVSRVFDLLLLKKWSGQAHGIDSALPSRPPGNIIYYCPACIEVGVNTTHEEVSQCPNDLRHLITKYKTIDGNHHANRYAKNTDKRDVSLWEKYFGYFPNPRFYSRYLAGIPQTKEKSICNFITAVNSQDKQKFRGNDETGLVNVLCKHVMVESCVDMYFGERFVYSDLALARAFETRLLDGVRVIIAYDCVCSYCVNALSRFKANLPQHADTIAKSVFTIDSLHVYNHQDRCIYLYSTYYQDSIGHFDAVGTEQFWAENNQLGPQCRQMNPGHRQDKFTQGIADWNQKKASRMPRQLARNLRVAWTNYIGKRDFFKELSGVLQDHVPQWYQMDRRPKVDTKGGVESVYRHTASKVLSMDTVLRKLTSNSFSLPVPSNTNPSEDPAQSQMTVSFLAEGINIKGIQIQLRQLIERNSSHPLLATKRDIEHTREELQKCLEHFRNDQLVHMKTARNAILEHEPKPVEVDALFLPSEFSAEERKKFDLGTLGDLEAELWEGQASECILRLRCIMKLMSAFEAERQKNPGGQREGTRRRTKIQTLEFLRDRVLTTYAESRSALDSLGKLDGLIDRYPPLTERDLYRKSTRDKRFLGDTNRPDGGLWGVSGQRKADRTTHESHPKNSERSDGKLWSPIAGLTDEEFEEWEKEEDRVQWFRAWAEMMRWMEEFELKHAEFTRCIRSFRAMATIWEDLSAKAIKPGYAPFARRQADMYLDLAKDAQKLFERHGEKRFVHPQTTLIDAVVAFRWNELGWLHDLAGVSMDLGMPVDSESSV